MQLRQLFEVILHQKHILEHSVLRLRQKISNTHILLLTIDIPQITSQFLLDLFHLLGILLRQPLQQLLTAKPIAKIGAIQLVESSEVDKLVAYHDKIGIFLLANHADSAHHQIAQLHHALKFRKKQIHTLTVYQLPCHHRLLYVF